MSLIIGLCYKNQFVIVSNDTKVTTQYHDENFNRINDEITDTDLKEEKISLLTDYVLLCVSGLMVATDLVKRELKKRVLPKHDLTECSEILEHLLNDLHSGAIRDLTKEEENYVKVLNTTHFNCELVGFNKKTGTTGLSRHEPGSLVLNKIEAPINKNGYPVFIDSPEESDLEYQRFLDLPAAEQSFENFINQFLLIHANLSYKHINISSDCNFHILVRENQSVKYLYQTIETSDFYEKLGLSIPIS